MIDTQAGSGGDVLPPDAKQISTLHWPICQRCGYSITRVESTWHTKDGLIHRRRVCDHCGQWGFQTVEKPETFICGNMPRSTLPIFPVEPTVMETKPNPVAEIRPSENPRQAENGHKRRKGRR